MTIEVRPAEVPVKEKTVADVLRHAALVIEERGWTQGEIESRGAVCAIGAIAAAEGRLDDLGDRWDLPSTRLFARWLAPDAPDDYQLADIVWQWNDDAASASEVTAALRAAANAWEADQ